MRLLADRGDSLLCCILFSCSLSYKFYHFRSSQTLSFVSLIQKILWALPPSAIVWELLKGRNCVSCRTHLICIPSLRDHPCLIPLSFRPFLFFFFNTFCVYFGGFKGKVNPACYSIRMRSRRLSHFVWPSFSMLNFLINNILFRVRSAHHYTMELPLFSF